MLHLRSEDNWKIYTKLHLPEHQRIEMGHQAWLGGLDRPFMRPRCTTKNPLWLEKKRHQMRIPELQGPESPLERYVLQWEEKFHSFRGTLRPTADDMHIAFELVERPLDLSYALQVLNWCRNENDIHFAKDSFRVFLEACLRVDRKDVAVEALNNAEVLGFWHVDDNIRSYLSGAQTWYAKSASGALLPVEENGEGASASVADTDADDEARLAEELAALEALEAKAAARKQGGAAAETEEEEEARLMAELEALEASEKK
jgi:hypothetical protein